MASQFIEVAAADELPVGRATVRAIGDRKIALYHTEKGFFATDNTCPHRGGPLGEGDLMGQEIVCPWHLWTFDIETGQHDLLQDVRVTTHEVEIRNGKVFVRLASE
ncbi:MAG TPA: Rieske 2Fe-2S domain-containing protein [Thermoanaerobaculia bacterium]